MEDTIKVWRSPIVTGVPDELADSAQPGAIPAVRPTEVTKEFLRLCNKAKNLSAVFSGHLHFSHKDLLASGAPQYVTAPGYQGGCRVITLTPA